MFSGGQREPATSSRGLPLMILCFIVPGCVYSVSLFGVAGPLFLIAAVLLILVPFAGLDAIRVRRYRGLSKETSSHLFAARRSPGSSTGTLTIDERGISLDGPHRIPEAVPWDRVVDIAVRRRSRLAIGSICTIELRLRDGRRLAIEVSDSRRVVEAVRQYAPDTLDLANI